VAESDQEREGFDEDAYAAVVAAGIGRAGTGSSGLEAPSVRSHLWRFARARILIECACRNSQSFTAQRLALRSGRLRCVEMSGVFAMSYI
jgi:hypothetical protein